ncbi:MAG: lysophospholipid acyltransferase family protein [Cyanobacteria bacterium]|nr:lysophospholipid acyltransferase family protein [Cyanobacteriota bacterium]
MPVLRQAQDRPERSRGAGAGSREPGADWRQSAKKRAEVAAIATVGYPLLGTLGSTWKWRMSGDEHDRGIVAKGQQPILAFWHGRIPAATLYFKRRGMVVITSENYDGEWIARIINKFGYGTARGSTSRGGARALLQLVRDVKSNSVAFTVDGPRGPAEVAQLGAVWLSKATGNPLMPFHAEARSHWTLNSWDRTQIPKPFTTVATAIAEPIYVPRDADDRALEEWRSRLEEAIAWCKQRCLEQLCR